MKVASLEAVDHYQVLGLPAFRTKGNHHLSKDDIKTAYHQTLLLHHPDKAQTHLQERPGTVQVSAGQTVTVDQIVTAYQVLSDPAQKLVYDQALLRKALNDHLSQTPSTSTVGAETLDLEDLIYSEPIGAWTHSCRCGAEPAFVITEEQLELEAQSGEILLGCRGCSLHIRVLFQALDGS